MKAFIARCYDTTDMLSSQQAASKAGLKQQADRDLGDQWGIELVGTSTQHAAFASSEGYTNDEYSDVPLLHNPALSGLGGSHRCKVMEIILDAAREPVFTSKLQQAGAGLLISTISNTARRLVKQELLADLGRLYDAVAGRLSTKWHTTQKGLDWLATRSA